MRRPSLSARVNIISFSETEVTPADVSDQAVDAALEEELQEEVVKVPDDDRVSHYKNLLTLL